MRSHVRLVIYPLCALALAGCGLLTGSDGPVDLFNANSLFRYTIHNTPRAWSVNDGQLYADTAARQSVVIRKSARITDGWVETESDLAADGGLVLRFTSEGSYYLLAFRDDSNYSWANVEMYRAVNGAFTTIAGPLDIPWAPGTRMRVRFEADGSTLTAYLNGTPVLRATDTLYETGGFGLRHDNTHQYVGIVSRFDVLRWGRL